MSTMTFTITNPNSRFFGATVERLNSLTEDNTEVATYCVAETGPYLKVTHSDVDTLSDDARKLEVCDALSRVVSGVVSWDSDKGHFFSKATGSKVRWHRALARFVPAEAGPQLELELEPDSEPEVKAEAEPDEPTPDQEDEPEKKGKKKRSND